MNIFIRGSRHPQKNGKGLPRGRAPSLKTTGLYLFRIMLLMLTLWTWYWVVV